METISVLNDEKPASKAAILNLPGNQFLGVNGTAGYTLPACSPPLLTPPGVHSLVEEDFLTVCWRSHFFHISWERGGGGGAGTVHTARMG